ncbi:MAG: DUF1269 domain-containing protein [Vulcanimicrobiota bacterium]
MLPELIVLSFPTTFGASKFLEAMVPLHEEHLIRIEDAAIAVKNADGRVRGGVRQEMAVHGLLSGSIWGTLTGALFLEPFLGMVLGGLIGMFTGGLLSQAHNGINSRVVAGLADRALEPNSSALFLLVSKLTLDKVVERTVDHDATIVRTSFSHQEERQFRNAWKAVRQEGALALRDSRTTRILDEERKVITKF